MARKKKTFEEPESELNLAPIMNMVMILIPLLLLSTEFMKAGVVNISSPRDAQSTQEETEEREEDETPVPRVIVMISSDGFRVVDQRNLPAFAEYSQPISRCASGDPDAAGAAGVPTICLLPDVPESAPLVERLDYASLYNRLAQIRLNPEWFDRFGEDNNDIIQLLGDGEVPFAALMKTMDTARFFLSPTDKDPGAPSAAVDISTYLLGDGVTPTLRQLEEATLLLAEGEEGGLERFTLFPSPVLQLPRPSSGS